MLNFLNDHIIKVNAPCLLRLQFVVFKCTLFIKSDLKVKINIQQFLRTNARLYRNKYKRSISSLPNSTILILASMGVNTLYPFLIFAMSDDEKKCIET